MATVDILLPGMYWSTTVSRAAFCMIALVESEGRRIIVDTGHAGRRTELEDALRGRGLTVADIDTVFLTHAHFDHVQNFDLFPDATVLLHPREHRSLERPHPNDYATRGPLCYSNTRATRRVERVALVAPASRPSGS